jgi:hypothetical protein
MENFILYKKELSLINDENKKNENKINMNKYDAIFNNDFYFIIDEIYNTDHVELLSFNELSYNIDKYAIYNKECNKINTTNQTKNNVLNKLLILFNKQLYNKFNNDIDTVDKQMHNEFKYNNIDELDKIISYFYPNKNNNDIKIIKNLYLDSKNNENIVSFMNKTILKKNN